MECQEYANNVLMNSTVLQGHSFVVVWTSTWASDCLSLTMSFWLTSMTRREVEESTTEPSLRDWRMVRGRWYELCSQALAHHLQYGSNEKLKKGLEAGLRGDHSVVLIMDHKTGKSK